jgi:hypothetical protein
MPNYRKKPVVIQAVQYAGNSQNNEAMFVGERPDWLRNSQTPACPIPPEGKWTVEADHIVIGTKEGMHIASKGDYIIQGIAGELYPCKPDIFAATYQLSITEPELRGILGLDELDAPLAERIGDWVRQSDGTYIFEGAE